MGRVAIECVQRQTRGVDQSGPAGIGDLSNRNAVRQDEALGGMKNRHVPDTAAGTIARGRAYAQVAGEPIQRSAAKYPLPRSVRARKLRPVSVGLGAVRCEGCRPCSGALAHADCGVFVVGVERPAERVGIHHLRAGRDPRLDPALTYLQGNSRRGCQRDRRVFSGGRVRLRRAIVARRQQQREIRRAHPKRRTWISTELSGGAQSRSYAITSVMVFVVLFDSVPKLLAGRPTACCTVSDTRVTGSPLAAAK